MKKVIAYFLNASLGFRISFCILLVPFTYLVIAFACLLPGLVYMYLGAYLSNFTSNTTVISNEFGSQAPTIDISPSPISRFFFIAVTLGVVYSLYIGFCAFIAPIFRKAPFENGIQLKPKEQAMFYEHIQYICNHCSVKPPDAVIFVGSPSCYVQHGKIRLPKNQMVKGRILVIGIPILNCLTVEELSAVLTHELAHFSGMDTLYTAYVFPVYVSLNRSREVFRSLTKDNYVITRIVMYISHFVLLGYHELFNYINLSVIREREYRADRIAAHYCGSNSISNALVYSTACIKSFNDFVAKEYNNLSPTETIYSKYRSYIASDKEILETAIDESIVSDSRLDKQHPSLADRLSRIDSIDVSNDSRPILDNLALSLLNNISAFEEIFSGQLVALLKMNTKILQISSKAVPLRYATLVDRIESFILDLLIITLPLGILFLFSSYYFGNSFDIVSLTIFLYIFLYSPIMESTRLQATFAKKIKGIKVSDYQTRRITLGKAFVRSVFKLIPLGWATIYFSRNKQMLHDLICQTYVIKDISINKNDNI